MTEQTFTQYRRKQIAELRPYVPGEDMERVSVAAVDGDAGSPKVGDMIARNPKNHADQWLVAKQYFEDNFEPLSLSQQTDLQALIAKWRESAAFEADEMSNGQRAQTLDQCANELEALLAAVAPVAPQDETFKHLASAMRKVLPPELLAEVVAHLDPLTPFLDALALAEAGADPEP